MCRWFAYISMTEDCLLEDVLVTPAHALSKQVHEHYLPKLLSHDPVVHAEPTTQAEISERNRLFNVDGFGMAWYTPNLSIFTAPHITTASSPILHPALYKTIQPPLHDLNFRSICASTASRCVIGHIRAATSTAITPVNNHPFAFGRHTIMHNGYIADFSRIARQMQNLMSPDAFENLSGRTDTEHFAALYMTYLTFGDGKAGWEKSYSTQKMFEAMQHTANTIVDLQGKTLGEAAQPNDLNICVTDGTQLVVMRSRNHATEQPPSLYYSEKAGVTLNRKYPDHPDGAKGSGGPIEGKHAGDAEGHNPHAQKEACEHGRHVIVSSEPTTYKDKEWTLIEKNVAVMVGSDGSVNMKKVIY
ncbi:MAG: hypothetical protein M1818_004865 [Claussenomyces sp. TS43310]|nr:MAG: hypothetical protein M1818_004865 [Claussenomyces sp. TS43310]